MHHKRFANLFALFAIKVTLFAIKVTLTLSSQQPHVKSSPKFLTLNDIAPVRNPSCSTKRENGKFGVDASLN